MIDNSQQVLKSQKIRFAIVAIFFVMCLFGITHFINRDFNDPKSFQSVPLKVDLPVDNINPQSIWMNRQDGIINRMESENKLFDQKMRYLEDMILSHKKGEEESNVEKLELKKMISHLQQDLKHISEKSDKQVNNQIQSVEPNAQMDMAFNALPASTANHIEASSALFSNFDSHNYFSSPKLSSIEIAIDDKKATLKPPIKEYVMGKKPTHLTSVNDVVPAAVSVKALLVSSVDAVCGVYANSDPIPVKLRLLDDAHLPKGVTIKLKGCLLIASAFGNISNERVYMRLERLTQINPNGEAIETEVVGYVSGEDGKFGVQGTVIDRSAKIVKNAAISGFLGGVGQVLQSAVSKHPVDSFNNYSVGTDIAQRGIASGTSSAFDMLADYYIRRAEQVQPVLQVNAGRFVDITFTHGFALGDRQVKEKLKKIRSRNRGNS